MMDTVFFFVSKILPLLLFPIPGFLILGLILVNRYGIPGKKFLLSSPFLLIWLLSTSVFSRLLIQPLEDEFPPGHPDQVPKRSIAIVLGGMFNTLTRYPEIPELNSSSDRLISAVELYRKGKVEKILFTGGSGTLFFDSLSEGEQAKLFFQNIGIPDSAILIEKKSRNTRENALETYKLLKESNLLDRNLVLITSAFHMGRSVKSFHRIGLKVIPYPCDYRTQRMDAGPFETWVPRPVHLEITSIAIKEWLGRPSYAIFEFLKSQKSNLEI